MWWYKVQACDPSTWEAGTGKQGAEGQPVLQTDFEASLDYMKPSLKTQPNKQKNRQQALKMYWNPQILSKIILRTQTRLDAN